MDDDLVAMLAQHLAPAEVARRRREQFVQTRRPVLEGHLADVRTVEDVALATPLERLPTVVADLYDTILVFEGKTITFPEQALEALAEVTTREGNVHGGRPARASRRRKPADARQAVDSGGFPAASSQIAGPPIATRSAITPSSSMRNAIGVANIPYCFETSQLRCKKHREGVAVLFRLAAVLVLASPTDHDELYPIGLVGVGDLNEVGRQRVARSAVGVREDEQDVPAAEVGERAHRAVEVREDERRGDRARLEAVADEPAAGCVAHRHARRVPAPVVLGGVRPARDHVEHELDPHRLSRRDLALGVDQVARWACPRPPWPRPP